MVHTRGCSLGSPEASEKSYFCKVQLGEIWASSDVRCVCEAQAIRADAIFSHILDCVCVFMCVCGISD